MRLILLLCTLLCVIPTITSHGTGLGAWERAFQKFRQSLSPTPHPTLPSGVGCSLNLPRVTNSRFDQLSIPVANFETFTYLGSITVQSIGSLLGLGALRPSPLFPLCPRNIPSNYSQVHAELRINTYGLIYSLAKNNPLCTTGADTWMEVVTLVDAARNQEWSTGAFLPGPVNETEIPFLFKIGPWGTLSQSQLLPQVLEHLGITTTEWQLQAEIALLKPFIDLRVDDPLSTNVVSSRMSLVGEVKTPTHPTSRVFSGEMYLSRVTSTVVAVRPLGWNWLIAVLCNGYEIEIDHIFDISLTTFTGTFSSAPRDSYLNVITPQGVAYSIAYDLWYVTHDPTSFWTSPRTFNQITGQPVQYPMRSTITITDPRFPATIQLQTYANDQELFASGFFTYYEGTSSVVGKFKNQNVIGWGVQEYFKYEAIANFPIKALPSTPTTAPTATQTGTASAATGTARP